MARKGDIDSKSVAARVPMEVYLNLLQKSSSNKKTLSSYLCDILSDDGLNPTVERLKNENEQLILMISEFVKLLSEPRIKKIIDDMNEEIPSILKMDGELFKKVVFHAFKKK
jgi:hypothetical protein